MLFNNSLEDCREERGKTHNMNREHHSDDEEAYF